ncbi:MAG TPA: c-type cytochrome [Candidatus Paceibacterota bacterium]|nr:c-type cytochrome [Candidatus Paceibacterota bacterium]
MHTFPISNKRRQVRLTWSCVTAAIGCIVFAQAMAQNAPTPVRADGVMSSASTNQIPTYLRDIRPIFMSDCARCHNEQSLFVYDWLDYKAAYADRWELKRRIWDSWKGTYYQESMPVANSPESQNITDEDRLMILNWVENGAPLGVEPPTVVAKTKAERIVLGRRTFMICSACHQPTGRGLPNVFPPLAGSDFLNADKDRAIKTVIFGRRGDVVVNGQKFNNTMPSLPLTDQDIANVLTYVYNSFGNSGLDVTPEEVKTLRAQKPVPTMTTPEPQNPFE